MKSKFQIGDKVRITGFKYTVGADIPIHGLTGEVVGIKMRHFRTSELRSLVYTLFLDNREADKRWA